MEEEINQENKQELLKQEAKKIKKMETKKIKNLISLVILLSGLLVGSLFVDFSQLIKGNGYSEKNLNKSDVFEANGKTWVAYNTPAVPVSVITDDKCKKCNPSEVLVWLRQVMPTISTEKVSFNSKQGKKIIKQFNIKTLPTFIFNPAVKKTELYNQAKAIFNLKNKEYILDTQKLGLPVGEYLEAPKVNKEDATFGQANAKVKVIVYSDFQCPYCKIFYKTLRGVMKEYKSKVLFVFKELPLNIHPQANNAALASECALKQGKFWEYADNLYAKQSQWANTKGTASFKHYAGNLKLNVQQFNQCLNDKTGQAIINANQKEAAEFGISGTPTIFINKHLAGGAITVSELKDEINRQLK